MSDSSNFGGITDIKHGRAQPVWRARVAVNGQRHTRNFPERADAVNWLEQLRHEYLTNKFEIARQAETLRFDDAVQSLSAIAPLPGLAHAAAAFRTAEETLPSTIHAEIEPASSP